jgi:hypothetical protein
LFRPEWRRFQQTEQVRAVWVRARCGVLMPASLESCRWLGRWFSV